jgi:hypothetical protein
MAILTCGQFYAHRLTRDLLRSPDEPRACTDGRLRVRLWAILRAHVGAGFALSPNASRSAEDCVELGCEKTERAV